MVFDDYIYDTQVYYNVTTQSMLHIPLITVFFSTLYTSTASSFNITSAVTTQKYPVEGKKLNTAVKTTTNWRYGFGERKKYTLPQWYYDVNQRDGNTKTTRSTTSKIRRKEMEKIIYEETTKKAQWYPKTTKQLDMDMEMYDENYVKSNPFDFLKVVHPRQNHITEGITVSAEHGNGISVQPKDEKQVMFYGFVLVLAFLCFCFLMYFVLTIVRWIRKRKKKQESRTSDMPSHYRSHIIPEMCDCMEKGRYPEKEALLDRNAFQNIELDRIDKCDKNYCGNSKKNSIENENFTTADVIRPGTLPEEK